MNAILVRTSTQNVTKISKRMCRPITKTRGIPLYSELGVGAGFAESVL
jgi:hypothetical protein